MRDGPRVRKRGARADNWKDMAPCYGEPADTFYIDGTVTPRAKELCGKWLLRADPTEWAVTAPVCPVHAQCLSAALDNPADGGTWAGTNQRQRVVLRRKRRESAERQDAS